MAVLYDNQSVLNRMLGIMFSILFTIRVGTVFGTMFTIVFSIMLALVFSKLLAIVFGTSNDIEWLKTILIYVYVFSPFLLNPLEDSVFVFFFYHAFHILKRSRISHYGTSLHRMSYQGTSHWGASYWRIMYMRDV